MRKNRFGLPNPTTAENLGCQFSKVLRFGDRVLVAGYRFNGADDRCYYGAVYGFLGDDKTIEGPLGLLDVSGLDFVDDGHAIAWAMGR